MRSVVNRNGIKILDRRATARERFERMETRLNKYGSQCSYCNSSLSHSTFSIDHVFPVAHGGSNARDNRVACCKKCNGIKADCLLDEFAVRFEAYYGRPLQFTPPAIYNVFVELYKFRGLRPRRRVTAGRPCRVCGEPVQSTDFRRVHTFCLVAEPFEPKTEDRMDWCY